MGFLSGKNESSKNPGRTFPTILAGIFELCPKIAKKKKKIPLAALAEVHLQIFPKKISRENNFSALFARGKTTRKNFSPRASRAGNVLFPLASLAEKLPLKIFPRSLRSRKKLLVKIFPRALRAREYTFSARFARGTTTRKNFSPLASLAEKLPLKIFSPRASRAGIYFYRSRKNYP